MSMVTVAMNVFNGMPFLPAAVESIQNQTLKDIQIIIVNDGSVDGSRDYLDSLQDPRMLVIHQENQGTSVASNKAIQECKTPYLARMDADDISLPNRLERQLAYMQSHPEVGMSGTQLAWFGTHTVGRSIKLPLTHEAIWKALVGGNHAMCHATLMMRTSLIRDVGGYWDYRHLDDDTDMMLRMGEAARLANIDDTLYHYRIHQKSMCGTGMQRIRFSYNYSIELARRRKEGLPSIEPDQYVQTMHARTWISRLRDSVDLHARNQYRLAVEEMFGNNPLRGKARLAWAAMCSPRLSTQRILRMIRPNQANHT